MPPTEPEAEPGAISSSSSSPSDDETGTIVSEKPKSLVTVSESRADTPDKNEDPGDFFGDLKEKLSHVKNKDVSFQWIIFRFIFPFLG